MKRFTALFLLAAAAAVPARAQTTSESQPIDEVRKNAPLHVGALYFAPSLQLKELGVDGNVFNASGNQVSDFTFTLTPEADAYLPIARRMLLRATAASDLVWYAKYETERSVDPQLGGRAEIYLRRVTLFAEHEYVNSRQRLNYEIDVRTRHVQNTSSGGLDVRLTPKLSVEAAGRFSDTAFDADASFDGTSLRRTLNRKNETLTLTTRERLTPLTTLALRVDRMRDTFEFSPARNSESYRVMPGLELKPRALVKGSAFVGYRKFTAMDQTAGLPPFSGLVADLGLSYTLLGATTFGVTYSRDLTYSYEELQPFFVNQSVGASVRRALGRRFDLLVSADRHQYAYRDLLVEPAGALPLRDARTDLIRNYAGSIGYRVGRDGRLGFGASYWKRTSTTRQFRDYDNLRFGTTLSYGF